MRNKSGKFLGVNPSAAEPFEKAEKRFVLTANRSEAVLYEDRPSRMAMILKIENPKGSLPERELDSDRAGRGFSSATQSAIRHALDHRFQHKEEEAKKFARRIAKDLNTAQIEHHFTELYLVSEPHFLGVLRKALPTGLRKLVKHEIRHEFQEDAGESLKSWIQKSTA